MNDDLKNIGKEIQPNCIGFKNASILQSTVLQMTESL